MQQEFSHQAANLTAEKPIVYTAMSKHLFYYRMLISQYVLEQGKVPLNPFMLFDYFLLDTLDRDLIREANNNVLRRSDELWVFGTVSNGVLAEILLAKSLAKPVIYFKIERPHRITLATKEEVELEDDVSSFRNQL